MTISPHFKFGIIQKETACGAKMIQKLFVVLVSFNLTGCTMFPGIIMSESHFESVPHRVSSEVVAGLQPGAVVHILYDSPQTLIKRTSFE